MNKNELQNLLNELTTKEIEYQNHPENRDSFFKTISLEETPIFDLTNSLHQNKFFQNDPQRSFFTYNDIEFVQHTRFTEPPLHKHSHIELTYVYQGSCKQIFEEKTISLTQGDLCLLDSNVVHTIGEVFENDIVINIIMKKSFFNDAFLNRLSKFSFIPEFILQAISEDNTNEKFMIFHPNNQFHINEIVENMLIEYMKNDFYSEETIKSYLIIFFAELIRNHELIEQRNISEPATVLSILKYIEENYLDIDLNQLSNVFNYHPNYIARLLKTHTNRTFKELVINHKINKAVFLLKNTDLSVEEVAATVGYHNQTFFYKKFKEYMGCTPYYFRKHRTAD